MELDDEEAPSLVDVAEGTRQTQSDVAPVSQLQDLSLTRVPLTIVTGKLFDLKSNFPKFSIFMEI